MRRRSGFRLGRALAAAAIALLAALATALVTLAAAHGPALAHHSGEPPPEAMQFSRTHIHACRPTPAPPYRPYLGPTIDDAILYDDWIAEVVVEAQGCDMLRVPAYGELRVPVDNPEITSQFGMRFHPVHNKWMPHPGTDFVNRAYGPNAPVYSAGAGTVIARGDFDSYGRTVVLDHGDRIATVYTHLNSIHVGLGEELDQGEFLGRLGSSGAVTGPHLHFEVRLSGAAVDPMNYISLGPLPATVVYYW